VSATLLVSKIASLRKYLELHSHQVIINLEGHIHAQTPENALHSRFQNAIHYKMNNLVGLFSGEKM
jgi:hypothetical protein